jgi:K(+)-stimulated pyrophosphate-energized sodium pump
MKFIKQAWQRIGNPSPHRGVLGLLLALFFTLTPALALAGEGDVKLQFTGSDFNYLYASLGFGVIALVAAFVIIRMVMAVSPGTEKMQEVSQAIKEGAMAYLKRQMATMIWFIIALAIGLFFLYNTQYGWQLGLEIAGCFVLGVAASYVAGLTGMVMAVNGNTRTAAAALTSYKKALETAFRSGSVAGMVTVGLGLLGATTIFLLAKEDAMKLLVGFGFGGSLAALFMRVGGGIFTKAADVGADLVGKVEAGIPEDDPRNPATIADNVGDNVGDCAGMAADIFESYEVTLVAAIILGAATASIFDQTTWMKLILFALMARGAGIVASIFGVICVRGSDNVDSDPLLPIRRGFWVSAAVAAIATLGLGYFMMGSIKTNNLKSADEMMFGQLTNVKTAAKRVATKLKKEVKDLVPGDVQNEPEIIELGLGRAKDETENKIVENELTTMLASEIPEDAQPQALKGLKKIDLNGTSKALDYKLEASTPTTTGKTLGEYAKLKPYVYHLKVTEPVQQGAGGSTVDQKTMTVDMYQGAYTETELNETIEKVKPHGVTVEVLDKLPISFYENDKGELMIAVEGAVKNYNRISINPLYYKKTGEQQTLATGLYSQMGVKNAAFVDSKPVDWWRFPLCIVFGIVMAFLIEFLTDYYVSLHKKPVQEVAGTSTTGPATMIITGFAYGLESSVFSVFAIVLALMGPMIIFPPAVYGGYLLSFYGIALVGLGLLTTTGFILGEDTFGPISDNAQGIFEMSGCGEGNEEGSKAVQRLDAAGNTTKALTKGFAIATAVVAAVALFHSYLDEAHLSSIGLRLDIPEIFLGLLIGGAAPYLFSAFSINAVGRAAFKLINEVRSQFRNDPGIMAGTSKPNYGRCVAIVTQAAQQELLGPGIIAIFLPAAVAFGFSIGKPTVGGFNLTGAQALGGYLAGAILSGQLMAVLLSNSGGIWDNAKKYIEDGAFGGKGSEAHKAGVVCDTVGDPFKDTAGPALNPLIKVMNLVAILLAPIVIQPMGTLTLVLVTLACLALLGFSVYWSKRASMSSELAASNEEASATATSTD